MAGPLVCPAFLSVPGRAVSGGSDGLWVKVADCVAPQLKPCVCPGPMAGQVQDGSSLGAGQAGGNVDDLAAQGGAARDGVLLTGECGGRAQQVVGDRRTEYPGGVGAEAAGGHVRQRPVDQVGEHGFDDRVAAVGEVGLGDRFGGVGDKRVILATPGTARRGSVRL